LRLTSNEVLVTGMKPSDDGRGLILRLWGASGRDVVTRLEWSDPQPAGVWESDTSESRGRQVAGEIAVPAWVVVNLRVELE
jgi:alpha-mannosidase